MADITYLSNIEQESADCTTAVLVDLTPWGVSPVPARNTIALFLRFVKRNALLVDSPISINNGSPLSVTQWNFNLQGDGWYYATFFGFPVWAAGSYSLGNCVYYSSNSRYYKAKGTVSSIPTTSADWEDITSDPTAIELSANTNVAVNYTHNFTTCNGEIKVGDVLEDLSDQITDSSPKDWEDTTTALLGLALINGGWVKHYRVKNQQAQVIMDFINQKYPSRL